MDEAADGSALDRLATARGIGRAWYDYKGELREFPAATRVALLRAMGVDASDESAIERAVDELAARRWQVAARPVTVLRSGEPFVVELALPQSAHAESLRWNVTLEDGSRRHGVRDSSRLERIEQAEVRGVRYERLRLPLPPTLPIGYHRIRVRSDSGLDAKAAVIVAPAHCHDPTLSTEAREWGITVQLYTLRSARNWGIGDFGDLADLVALAAPLGCAVVGLNPLHAMMPANPAHSSPYSPSSRQFLNVLYIDVPAVPEYAVCAQARAQVETASFGELLADLRAAPNVDYVRVARAKLPVLRMLFDEFGRVHLDADTERAREFRGWVAARGEPLRRHALYDALDQHLREQDSRYWGWPAWPEEFRDPATAMVKAFARTHTREVDYYLYLQWLAESQLAQVQLAALAAGMSLGLYGDVAVGVNPAGSETWSDRDLYLTDVSIGAPPDPLGPTGQDWGIPPQDPAQLQREAYAPFITMLRNNMRHGGALRLDHVMALCRQWWVPRGLGSSAGAYVHYPLADLMNVLALESVRNTCLVVGEDLGTVPDEMRAAMTSWHLNHYKVLIFEKTRDGRYRRPDEYVRHALATVTTHDLPTLRGWWEGRDIAMRESLGFYADPSGRMHDEREREIDRRAMMSALVEAKLWYWQSAAPVPAYSHALLRAIHLYLAKSTSLLAVLQLEDLAGMTEPVNVPGTSVEHANWQRKMSTTAEAIFARDEVRELLAAMGKARRGEDPNA
jgi:4-alpha-glucanotransferase